MKLPIFILSFCSMAFSAGQSLEEILRSTIQKNGQIQESLMDVEIARAQLDLAKSALFPKASALLIAAPIFEERGNAISSESNWSKWGPFIKTGVEIIQPIYTFGMISSYRRAAENQIIAREELASAKRGEMVAMAKEFYYGYLMARDLEELVEDLATFLEEAVTSAEDSLKDKKKSNVKSHDVFKLKTVLEDLR